MPETTFDITPIARELNTRAQGHPIGQLQSLRTELKGLSRRPGTEIFSGQTIHPHWAFHHGGRSELQFNIGLENVRGRDELRHGVAFSFQLSQTLPDIDGLIPKVRLFNDYMQLYPDHYGDMRMWHHQNGQRSSDYAPGAVMPELVAPGTFVFLGKRQPADRIDYESILDDFDRLLPLYRYVEGDGRERTQAAPGKPDFQFRPGLVERAPATTASLAERELNITLKHNLLQAALCRRLVAEHGPENVRGEQPSGLGTMIDVVLRRSPDEYWYYEIKTALSPRACVREALGQLLEYAYWPGAREASRLIICGESPLDDDGQKYVDELRRRFQLPISYEQIAL
jgi:hypothetical protein